MFNNNKINNLLSSMLFVVFPKRCAFCDRVISPNIYICDICNNTLPRLNSPACSLCGREIKECICKNHKCFYLMLASPFYYEGIIKKIVWDFKFNGKIQNVKLLALEMVKTAEIAFNRKKFDIVTCVPMTQRSFKERGYNQSFLLAEEIGIRLNVYFDGKIIQKIYNTPAQHNMNSTMRRGNLAGVFNIKNSETINNKTILLCDDVATTGSTLNECAKILLLSGAKEVYCITASVTRKANKF